MSLPDAETVFTTLAEKMRANVQGEIALIGIRTGGVWLAERLHSMLGIKQPLGILSVSFYRDDFDQIGLHAQKKPSEIPFDVNGAHIVLVDDVLFTGRTIRAAINELFDYGRPASIRLAALVDRGGRELPIEAQYVGIEFPIPIDKMLEVKQEKGHLSFHVYDKSPTE